MRRFVFASLLLVACGRQSRPAPEPAAPGKAELFGDAALVPTRAGEHARQELATAADLREAALGVPNVREATVAVRLPRPTFAVRAAEQGPPRAMISALADADAEPAEIQRALSKLAHGWLGPAAAVEVVVDRPPAAPDDERPWASIALVVFGLGASLGITVDRAADRVRTRKRK